MSVHYLDREQFIPAPLEQVWEYFCDPRNLNEMTPEDMVFDRYKTDRANDGWADHRTSCGVYSESTFFMAD